MLRLVVFLLTVLLCGIFPASAQEPLVLLYNERPPYQIRRTDGRVTGLTADPVVYALQKARIPFKWVPMPSARQLVKIQENLSMLAGVGWFKNPEREQFAKFSSPIYQDKRIVVLARGDNQKVAAARTVKELLADKSLLFLRKVGYSYGKDLDEWIAANEPATTQVTVENLSMIQMLHARRADYMFIAPEEAGVAVSQARFQSSDFQARTFPDMPQGEKRHLMFSRLVDDNRIKLINTYLDEYHATHK